MSNSKGAMRVKDVCIVFRITCDAQTIEEWVYLHSHEVLFLLHLMLIVLELIPFKFDDLSTQIWWTILCNVKDLDSILFKILNSLMCGLANFHLKFRLLWNFHRIYQDVQIYYLCPFPCCIFLFFFFFGWMILIYVAYCIALLLTTSIFYMGC